MADDFTIYNFTSTPDFEITKVATLVDVDNDGAPSINDRIDYIITVENIGNVKIESITIDDVLSRAQSSQGFNSTGLSEPTISFVSSLQGNSYQAGFDPTTTPFDLNVGDLLTFNSSYTIVVNDISDGFLINQITALGTYGGNPITETSDDGDDSDGNNSDDETVVQVSQNPEVSIIKSVATDTSACSAVSLGDLLTFTVM